MRLTYSYGMKCKNAAKSIQKFSVTKYSLEVYLNTALNTCHSWVSKYLSSNIVQVFKYYLNTKIFKILCHTVSTVTLVNYRRKFGLFERYFRTKADRSAKIVKCRRWQSCGCASRSPTSAAATLTYHQNSSSSLQSLQPRVSGPSDHAVR